MRDAATVAPEDRKTRNLRGQLAAAHATIADLEAHVRDLHDQVTRANQAASRIAKRADIVIARRRAA